MIIRPQQGAGGVIFWAGTIPDEIVGPFRVPKGVKLTSVRSGITSFPEIRWNHGWKNLPLLRLKNKILMHDNPPSHAAKATAIFLGLYTKVLMLWPANSPDLNPFESDCCWAHTVATCNYNVRVPCY